MPSGRGETGGGRTCTGRRGTCLTWLGTLRATRALRSARRTAPGGVRVTRPLRPGSARLRGAAARGARVSGGGGAPGLRITGRGGPAGRLRVTARGRPARCLRVPRRASALRVTSTASILLTGATTGRRRLPLGGTAPLSWLLRARLLTGRLPAGAGGSGLTSLRPLTRLVGLRPLRIAVGDRPPGLLSG